MVTTTKIFFSLSIKSNVCRVFIVSLYMCCRWRSKYQEKGLGSH